MPFLILLPLLFLLAAPVRAQDAAFLVTAARAQVGVTLIYDGAHVALDYPGGDVAPERGVCTDVLIRAFRAAWGIDLKRAIQGDMSRAFEVYPDQWGLIAPDRNIDHRRVPNLRSLFTRAGAELEPGTANPADDGIDVAARIGPLADSSLVARKLGETRRVVVAAPAYLANHPAPKAPKDLAAHNIIHFTGLSTQWQFLVDERPHTITLEPRLTTNSADAAIDHAERGGGLTMVLAYQVAEAVRAKRLTVVLPRFEPPPLPIHLVYPTARLLSAKVRAFVELAAEICDWRFVRL